MTSQPMTPAEALPLVFRCTKPGGNNAWAVGDRMNVEWLKSQADFEVIDLAALAQRVAELERENSELRDFVHADVLAADARTYAAEARAAAAEKDAGRELAWMRQFWHVDETGCNVVLRDADGTQIKEWMARVDALLAPAADAQAGEKGHMVGGAPNAAGSESAPAAMGRGNVIDHPRRVPESAAGLSAEAVEAHRQHAREMGWPEPGLQPHEVADAQAGEEARAATLVEWPEVGSTWLHKNGNTYTVTGRANDNALRPDYPPVVLYRGEDGRHWAKPLAEWHRSRTVVAKTGAGESA